MNRKLRRTQAKAGPAQPQTAPVDLQALFAEAMEHHQAGRLAEAEPRYRLILAAEPTHADALHLLGVIGHQVGRNDAAAELIGQAIAINAAAPAYYSNLGAALDALGRPQEAIASYRNAIALNSDYAQAHSNLGNALKSLERMEEAVDAYRVAIRLDPDFAEAYSNLGYALYELDRHDEAIAACLTAIRLAPGLPEAHCNLGNAFKALGRLDEALASYRMAANLKPDYAEAHSDIGAVLKDLGQLEEAIQCCITAIGFKPDFAGAHYNHSLFELTRGDLAAGWAKHEWRWRGAKGLKPRQAVEPQWRGEDIAGRTILLHPEQGAGDAIQFSRYAAMVAARGARVVLETPPHLLRLLSSLPGVDQFVVEGAPLPAFDYHCPLMSLPGAFGTTLETIPADIPYLWAEEDVVRKWRERMGHEGFRIGIAWQGNPKAPAEQGRSAPLAAFAPLAAIPGVRLISLQKGHGLEQLGDLPPGMTVETLGDDFDAGPDAFVDTAAAIMSLDLVVTVDTAVGHLAGALGRPVSLALQMAPHWVWMMDRTDSPWYPSHRLFRQSERGDWDGVFDRIAGALTPLARPG